MRVGVLPTWDRSAGGIYQYSLTVLAALHELRDRINSVIVYDGPDGEQLQQWLVSGWPVFRGNPGVRRYVRRVITASLGERTAERVGTFVRVLDLHLKARDGSATSPQRGFAAGLRADDIGLMIYPTVSTRAVEMGIPYVMAVHDVQHRISPEFPEVSAGGEWEARESIFVMTLPKAEALIVDSETGRDDVLEFYGHLLDPARVRVLPFVVPPYLSRPPESQVENDLRNLGVADRYLFLPAQFWPHKNHLRVAQAVGLLRRRGIDIPVVMTGSANGSIRSRTLSDLRKLVVAEGIEDLVFILGYVDDGVLSALYAAAAGVILPTFFGPTNIPVVEGWAMGVPVLTSDIRGIREQCGDAALLVDPRSVEAIADGMNRLWSDQVLRDRLVMAGLERSTAYGAKDFNEGFAAILEDVLATRPRITR